MEWMRSVPGLEYKCYPSGQIPGVCRARYDCNQMLREERYVLHLDSHMRFAMHWDVMLIDQLARCQDSGAILTGYCQDYHEHFDEPWDSDIFTDCSLCAAIIETMGGYYGEAVTPFLRAMYAESSGGMPVRGAMVSAHFLFGPAFIDRDIPNDPNLYFVGDELPMALRYYTHGYHVYHPGINCVWHLYEREPLLKEHGLTDGWPSDRGGDMILKLWIEKKRIMKLYGMEDNDQDLTGFDLGSVRSLRDFERFAGICFRTKTIAPHGLNGPYGEEV